MFERKTSHVNSIGVGARHGASGAGNRGVREVFVTVPLGHLRVCLEWLKSEWLTAVHTVTL